MLRPEHRQLNTLNRLVSPAERSTTASASDNQDNQSRFLAVSSDTDALVESLMPQGLSPNKEAIVKRLIEMWVAKAELDVA
ncbi:hypothetical protein [Stenomitos frigidus]|nr:hypothetical protein [Stenomitos frigidus]